MELLQIMGWLQQLSVANPSFNDDLPQKAAVGFGEASFEGVIIHDFHLHWIAIGRTTCSKPSRERRRDLLVEQDIFIGKADVFGSDRLSVRPLQPLTHVEGKDLVVVAHLKVFEDVTPNILHGQTRR